MKNAMMVALVAGMTACGGSVVSLGDNERQGEGGAGGWAGQWIASGGTSSQGGQWNGGYDASAGQAGKDAGGSNNGTAGWVIAGGAPSWSTSPDQAQAGYAAAPDHGYTNVPTGVATDVSGHVAVSAINIPSDFNYSHILACGTAFDKTEGTSGIVVLFGPKGSVDRCMVIDTAGDDAINALTFDTGGKLDVVGSVGGSLSLGGEALPFNGEEDLFVARYGTDGSVEWSKTFGYQGVQAAFAVATDTGRHVLAAGAFEGSIISGTDVLNAVGSRSAFLLKLDEDGNWQWGRSWGTGWAVAVGVAAAQNDDVVVLGMFDGTIEMGGLKYTSQGGKDLFLIALDSSGEVLWSKAFGNAEAQLPSSIAADSAGNIAIVGRSRGVLDFGGGPLEAPVESVFIAGFGADGAHRWSRQYAVGSETEEVQSVPSVAFDSQGRLLLAGAFDGVADFGSGKLQGESTDVFIASWSGTGQPLWSYKYGSYGPQAARALAYDPVGGLAVAGVYRESLNLGAGDMKAYPGMGAMFAVRYPPW